MNTPYDSPQLDYVLEALANKKRRAIVHELSLQPSTISHLAYHNNLSLPAIHKHMRILESANLIIRKKAGRTNFVALNNITLGVAQSWIGQYHVAWGDPQASLENYITGMKE